MKSKITILMVMLVLAIVAVGSVSATEDVSADVIDESADDIVVDEIATDDAPTDDADEISDDVVTPTRTSYTVYSNMSSDDINTVISTASSVGGGTINFASGTYSNMALVLDDDVILNGNGVDIYGNGNDNVFTISGVSGFTINGFNIFVNSTSKAAIYGSNVEDAIISSNTITGGKDGINIFQTYNHVTITDNNISGVTRDAISLVNHYTFDDEGWSSWGESLVSGNIIEGAEYAMFFGGNFKGNITCNTIYNCDYGMQFAGKKAVTNGKLSALISCNNISNVSVGIDMNHPSVIYLNVTNNNITVANQSSNFVVANNTNFHKATGGKIYFTNNRLYGLIKQSFINQTDIFTNIHDGTIIP